MKIAQSFVRHLLTDLNDATIARAILSLGQTFDLAVIAEGVENTGSMDFPRWPWLYRVSRLPLWSTGAGGCLAAVVDSA